MRCTAEPGTTGLDSKSKGSARAKMTSDA